MKSITVGQSQSGTGDFVETLKRCNNNKKYQQGR